MTITVIGHGYVGLVTACVFADFGNKVWVIGHTEEKLNRLKSGDPIIYEPGLKELLQKNLSAKRIIFTSDYKEPIAESDIVFITVGTPPKENGEADLSAVITVAKEIAVNLKSGYTVISCKSTVPLGTNKEIEGIINKNKPVASQFDVASCPEFLREGTALKDTLIPDRIIIGSESNKAKEVLVSLHKPIGGKRVITNLASAELIKYASNSILATKISFANLIAFYCEKTGGDVETVLDGVGLDHRTGRNFLYPGLGYGGSCFPKDVKALLAIGNHLGVDTSLLKAVEDINKQAKDLMVEKIIKNAPGKNIAVWGLSFKPDTDDIREAPSLYIIDKLLEKGFKVKAYDPVAMENVKKNYKGKIEFINDQYSTVKDSDFLFIATEWNEFKQIDLNKIKTLLKNPVIFDGRNIYDTETMKKLGFKYYSVGRI